MQVAEETGFKSAYSGCIVHKRFCRDSLVTPYSSLMFLFVALPLFHFIKLILPLQMYSAQTIHYETWLFGHKATGNDS